MNLIANISQLFLVNLAVGTFAFSFIIDPKKTGAGLLKVLSAVSFFCLVIGLLIHRDFSLSFNTTNLLAISSLLSFSLFYFNLKDRRTWVTTSFYLIAVFCSLALGARLLNVQGLTWVFYLLSAVFVGCINFSMILGHWYLVTPKLSEKPLLLGIKFISWALVAKVILSVYGAYQKQEFFSFTQMHPHYSVSFNWLMLIMRNLWGYIIIGILTFYAWRLTRMRSIQSATGVLYVMVFFMIIGELISYFLFYKYGLLI